MKNCIFSLSRGAFLFNEAGWGYGVIYFLGMFFMGFGIFMIGALLCGFFQCMIYRWDHGEKLFGSRSYCEFCGKLLKGMEPVSFLNYLFLKGKCRCCGKTLPVLYFLAESVSGLFFLILILSPVPGAITLVIAPGGVFFLALVFYYRMKGTSKNYK